MEQGKGKQAAGSWGEFNIAFMAALEEQDIDRLIELVQEKAQIQAKKVLPTGAFDSEDVAAEIVIKVYRNLDKYDPHRGAPSTWMDRVSQSVIKNTLRDTQNYRDFVANSAQLEEVDAPSNRSLLDLLEVEFELFTKALTDREQEVAKLRYQGLNNVEIADKLGISKQRVGVIVEQIRTHYMED